MMLGEPSSSKSNALLLQNRPPAIVLLATAIGPRLPLRCTPPLMVLRSSAMEGAGAKNTGAGVAYLDSPVDEVTRTVYFFGAEDKFRGSVRDEPAVDRGAACNQYSTLVDAHAARYVRSAKDAKIAGVDDHTADDGAGKRWIRCRSVLHSVAASARPLKPVSAKPTIPTRNNPASLFMVRLLFYFAGPFDPLRPKERCRMPARFF